ncbi:GH1 family beta-glucosidase [Sphingomonas sp. LB-2]|uniref:GH1 family beta-glucosidase n=1 Tax=Sphingomonas caeni TaxID=2984949 RepID=UPI00222E4551|nr:GH1 family beta-glucosidase [Sphingomonas caeni]MCW3846314.1 GH1 family beta-glucosidase [Sphingomonas caeni]
MTKFSRRDIGKTLGAAAAGAVAANLATGTAEASKAPAAASGPTLHDRPFPQDFKWGCATASYQVEGAATEDGRGPTNWDVFSHTPGKVHDGDTGDVANDSYHRYKEDHQLLKNLGVDMYRMSIAWSRIFPEGRGKPNQKGVDHYKAVLDDLLEQGIDPYVTMFHWDYPSALPGGWQNRDTSYAFADYAGYMAGQIGDRVQHFMTTNEIRCFTDLSHKQGLHAPGLKLGDKDANQVRHHGVLAHGLAVQAIRAKVPARTQIGLAENPTFYVPVMNTPEHIAAARTATRDANAMFLGVIMEGKYIDSYVRSEGANMPVIKDGDLKIISSPLDFVGLNCYQPNYARADANAASGYKLLPHPTSAPRMASPWLYVGPEVLYWAVRTVTELYGPKAIYITENGCSSDDKLVDGRVEDTDRLMYLRNYIGELQRAVAEGYPAVGYFLWSLMDNFEWADGYSKRFGIHYVDFQTQKRTPKLSAEWYKELIKRKAML